MTNCCLGPRAEGMTAHTARCLLSQQTTTTNVARLRALIGGGDHTETDEQGDQG